jgi:hypothetical protein
MRRQKLNHVAVAMAIAVAIAGCASGIAPLPQQAPMLAIDRQAFYAELARPQTSDWSDTRLTTPAVDRLRAAAPPATAARERRVQALGSLVSASYASPISSAPAFSHWANKAYWITENGTLIRRDMASGATDTISLGDTFISTAVTLSNDGLRAYLFSNTGKLHAVNLAPATMAVIGTFAIGGTNANVPNAPPPFIDPLASRPDGQTETVYVLSNTGSLVRFFVDATRTAPAPSITRKETFALPRNNTATHTEFFRSSPVIIGGKAVIGSWRRTNSGDSKLDTGNILYYNTGLNYIPDSATTAAGALTRTIPVSSPIWSSPAVEFDDDLTPIYAFAPTGYVVTIAELATGDQVQSVPLLVNQTTPQSGTLAGYNYGASGVVPRTVNVATNGCMTVGNTTAVPLDSGTWKDTSEVLAASVYDNTITEPIFAYLKFAVASTVLVEGGTNRAILDAEITLRCNSSSNGNKPVRVFRVSNDYSTGGAWNSTMASPASRPPFEDAVAFNLGNLNSHKAYELTPVGAGIDFNNGTRYRWSAKGLVTAAGTFSFGFANEDRAFVNTASNNGQPSRNSAPVFDGGTSGGNAPELRLTLSGNGLTTPTMTAPVTIDSANRRIYAVNTNALYVMSYASATYDASAPYGTASFAERKANFGDLAQTYFALTELGRTAGPTGSGQYIANLTAPLFDGATIYVQDHHSTTNTSAITAFGPPAAGALTAPTYSHAFNLATGTGGSADAQRGATYMSYDFAGRLYAGTFSTTGAGRLWVVSK